jgi:hypothetical protein
LQNFEYVKDLEIQMKYLEDTIENLSGRIWINQKLSAAYRKLRTFEGILANTVSMKQNESLRFLDRYSLYRTLNETILTMLEQFQMEMENPGHEPLKLSEVRAIEFVYLLIRWIEDHHRFPRQQEMHSLFSQNSDAVISIADLLSDSERRSPLVRALKREQVKANQRNSVGCGDDTDQSVKPKDPCPPPGSCYCRSSEDSSSVPSKGTSSTEKPQDNRKIKKWR